MDLKNVIFFGSIIESDITVPEILEQRIELRWEYSSHNLNAK